MRVLFTILNWGLGHATRSSPIIDVAISQGAMPIIASSGLALEYLSAKFPDCILLELPDKEVSYGKDGAGLSLLKRASQQSSINNMQHEWVRDQIRKHRISHIISDNVYGAYGDIPSVIITHQIGLISPLAQSIINKKLASWLDNFDAVWIPDIEGEKSLAGDLLVNDHFKGQRDFIGHLSRFTSDKSQKKDIPYLAVLSGPEPQREILEDKIKQTFKSRPNELVMVRGSNSQVNSDFEIETFGMLTETELQPLVNRAQNIICRSGYSSLMDFASVGINLCLIPTPQQPEQQYLALRGKEKKWFGTSAQKELSIDMSFNNYPSRNSSADGFLPILKDFLES